MGKYEEPLRAEEETVVPEPAPLVFRKPERRPPTPFEQEVYEAHVLAEEALSRAKSLKEFFMFTDAMRNLTPDGVRWAEQEGEIISAADWFAFFTRPELEEGFAIEAATAERLLQQLPETVGFKTVSLVATEMQETTRMGGDSRIVARMPVEAAGSDSKQELPYETVYMMLGTPCCSQAVHEILAGQTTRSVQFVAQDIFSLAVELGFATEGGKQNFRQRDAEGETIGQRDPYAYLQYALKRGFSNERRMFSLTEFEALKARAQSADIQN